MILRAVTRSYSVRAPHWRLKGRELLLASVLAGVPPGESGRELADILISPGCNLDKPSPSEYEAILDQLPQRDSLARFTSYLGPSSYRSDSAAQGGLPHGVPLVADPCFPGLVIIGFSSGVVRSYSYEDLGIASGTAPVFGPDSPTPLLRYISPE